MDEYLKKVLSQIADFYRSLTPGRRLSVAAIGAGIIVAIAGLFIWAGNQTYKPLATNLNPEDATNIIRVLREKNIPFQTGQAGREISVPPESLDMLRLELATMGMAQSNIVGYEVFDKTSLGTTSFVNKVNQKRAMEGELMRTISTIQGVRRARVHLALPQKSAFVEDQKKSTASVVLEVNPGIQLSEKQIFGIGNLVARAVEGLEPSDVVITDQMGKMLSKNNSDPLAAASATQLELKRNMEREFETRVENMLSRVVGDGRVVAKVSADLDFSQVNETQTTYDADGTAIRSVSKDLRDMDASRPGPTGVAGAQSNTPGMPPAVNGVKTKSNTENTVTNYEVPQTVRRTVRPGYSLQRLSVAVVVDGKQVRTTDKDGKVLSKVEAWPADKLKEFEDIIVGAVGLDRKRGDTLEIRNMEFSREDFDEAQRQIADAERKSYINNMILYGVVGLIILLFFVFVVRPFMKWVTENTIDSVDTFLPQTIEELERMQKNASLPGLEDAIPQMPDRIDPEKVEGEMIKEKIVTLVDQNPHKAALILRDWLHDKRKPAGEGEPGKDGKDGGKGKTA